MRRAIRSPFVALFVLATAGSSCAQVSGLADDYRYDLVAAAPTLDATADAGEGDATVRADSSASDARSTCGATERARAATQITSAGGDSLSGQCRQCLASNCCAQIGACANNADCEASMKCVFGCQNQNGGGNAKTQCLANCRTGFFPTVGACIQATCASPICQLL